MKRSFAIALLTAFVVSGCAARSVRVAELKGEPGRYATKTVSVNGVVKNSFGLGLASLVGLPSIYNVDDGSGEITVVSRNGGAPAPGTRIQVKGKINEFATFGNRQFGLHLQEEDRKIR